MKKLLAKIDDRTAVIGIVGLGYIGLPLAITFCNSGFRVVGFDMQAKKVAEINNGKSYISDVSDEAISEARGKKLLEATTDMSRLGSIDAVCICVPTPLTKNKEPDLQYVKAVSEELKKYLKPEQLVILESTTYPGTTREVILPVLEASGLKVGRDFYLAYSPEKVDPGNTRYGIKNTPKLVGGIEEKSAEIACRLYQKVIDRVIPVSSPEVAEMTKLFENVFRSVNIALVNEMSVLCENMGVSVWEVIDAASSKPFGFMPFYPGLGVGGHCIPLDPYYLSNKAREYDFHTRFIEVAASINENMPNHIANRISEALNDRGVSMRGARILILGIAYKKDIDDCRESPALKLMKLLKEKGAKVSYNDKYISCLKLNGETLQSIELDAGNLADADCSVIATDHPQVEESFTEFFILDFNSETDHYPAEFIMVADNITTVRYGYGGDIKEVEEQYGRVTLVIINNEGTEASYTIRLMIDGEAAQFILDGDAVSEIGPLMIDDSQEWQQEVGFTPVKIGQSQKVEFVLYKDGQPYFENPLYIWIDVIV